MNTNYIQNLTNPVPVPMSHPALPIHEQNQAPTMLVQPQRAMRIFSHMSYLIQMLFTYFSYKMGQKPRLYSILLNAAQGALIPIHHLMTFNFEALYYAVMYNSVMAEDTPDEFLEHYRKTLADLNSKKKKKTPFHLERDCPWFVPESIPEERPPVPQEITDFLDSFLGSEFKANCQTHKLPVSYSLSQLHNIPALVAGPIVPQPLPIALQAQPNYAWKTILTILAFFGALSFYAVLVYHVIIFLLGKLFIWFLMNYGNIDFGFPVHANGTIMANSTTRKISMLDLEEEFVRHLEDEADLIEDFELLETLNETTLKAQEDYDFARLENDYTNNWNEDNCWFCKRSLDCTLHDDIRPNCKSEIDLACESPQTHSVDLSQALARHSKVSRSQEKRNSKLSKRHLNGLIAQHRKEKKLTRLRSAERDRKESIERFQEIMRPHVDRNNRRLEKFLEEKKAATSEIITANSHIRRALRYVFEKCCAPTDDAVYQFLTSRCKFDEYLATILTPIIKALKKLLINNITMGAALCIFAYYLAKYVRLPIIVFTPLIALILGFIINDIKDDVVSAFVKIYEYLSQQWSDFQEKSTHLTDVKFDKDTFVNFNHQEVKQAVLLSATVPQWKYQFLRTLPQWPNRLEGSSRGELTIPAHVHFFLETIDPARRSPDAMFALMDQYAPIPSNQPRPNNGFTKTATYFTEIVSDLLSSIGIVEAAFKLPSAIHYCSSGKRFIKEIYDMFQSIYPKIYEYVTGKKYIDPQVAKYLAVFGETVNKAHLTLKTARSSNIVNESAVFRHQIIDNYEALLDTQMALLELKAPPQYMVPVNNVLRELQIIAQGCYARLRGESERPEPVLVLLRGPAGKGKTTIDHAIALIFAKRLGIEININTDFFIREATCKTWDGYANQMFTVIDDAFQVNTPESQAQTILETIKIKNTCPYKLAMAELADKKNTFFNSKIVFISTNESNITCQQITSMAAFYRRIDFEVEVLAQPPRNPDGTPSMHYDMTVNGQKSDIVTLADSIVQVYKTRIASNKSVSQTIAEFASAAAPTSTGHLIPPRNSTLNFDGVDVESYRAKPNADGDPVPVNRWNVTLPPLPEFLNRSWYYNTWNYARRRMPKAYQLYNDVAHDFISIVPTAYESAKSFLKWAAIAVLGFGFFQVVKTLVSSFSGKLSEFDPNSKKVKDQLTGDKKTKVTTSTSTVLEHLKNVQAKFDKAATTGLPKANCSSSRWSQAMISYIDDQGWADQDWVRDSLSEITFLDQFEMTTAEKEDLERLQSNMFFARIRYVYRNEAYENTAKGFILNQNTVVVNSHTAPRTAQVRELLLTLQGKEFKVVPKEIEYIPDSDTCVIKINTVLPCRDISYMILPHSEVTTTETDVYLLRSFDTVMSICPAHNMKVTDRVIQYRDSCNEIVKCGRTMECQVAVCPGDSGTLYVVRQHGRFHILAMHAASSFSSAFGRLMFREMFKNHIKAPRKAPVPYDSIVKAVEDASKNFDHAATATANCLPIGIVDPRTMISNRSKIHRSMLYKHDLLPDPTEAPAVLKRTFDDQDPLVKANAKFRFRDDPVIEDELFEEIVRTLLDNHPNLPVNKFYSNAEAIDGTVHMPRLTMSTASGYPYSAQGKTPKSKLEIADWVEITQNVDLMVEDLYNQHMPQAIFQTSFKDETRPFEKMKNPRVINCAPVSLTVLFRRILGPWMNMVHLNHNKISTKVGINVHGEDWKIFFENLVSISPDNIVELDYSGYEYNHPQVAFRIAAEFIRRLYVRSGFNAADAEIAGLLILSCCGGYVLQNDLLIWIWMLLSGLPITAELNSLLNEIYQMICFKKLTSRPLCTMKELVASGYYGDDLVHAVHEAIKHLFNALTIQKCCEEFLSMKVTPASNKSGELTPFIGILECSFLKRRFAPREDRVDAPIVLASSTDSLQYYVPVQHMNQRELLASKCRSFLIELTHYPEAVYNHWSDILAQLKSEFNLDFINYDYPAALAKRVVMPSEY